MVDLLDEAVPPGPEGPPFDPEGVLHLVHRLRRLGHEWEEGFGHRHHQARQALATWLGPLAHEFGHRIEAESAWCVRVLGGLAAEAAAWGALADGSAPGAGGGGYPAASGWAAGGITPAGRIDGASRVDVAALERFAAVGAAVRSQLGPQLAAVTLLDDEIRAATGPLSVPGGALDEGRRLLRACEDHEHEVRALAERISGADRASVAVWTSAASTGPAPAAGPGRLAAGEGRGLSWLDRLRASPWLDPGTDSLVVNVARAAAGGTVSTAFHQRLRTEGPGVARRLAATAAELSLVHQLRLAATDPERFQENWRAFGSSLIDGLGAMALSGAGAVSLTNPGFDAGVARLTGRRPAAELVHGLAWAAEAALLDPDELARRQVGWDQLHQDPYRWLGSITPDLALEVFLGGAGALRPRTVVPRTVAPRPHPLPGPVRASRLVDDLAAVAGPASHHLPDLAEVRRLEPEWAEAGPIVSHRQRPHETPETWAADLNGGGHHLPGRRVNCIDCARAAEANWRGQDAVAAPLRGSGRGTAASRLEEWSGGRLQPSSLPDVEARLSALGPGSSAMIVSQWKRGAAHAYNAVNDAGVVRWVDAQLGEVSRWPPPYASEVDTVHAIFLDARGVPVAPVD